MKLELNFLTWHRFDEPGYIFVYCVETWSVGYSRENEETAFSDCLSFVNLELERRLLSENLKNIGWVITESEINPPKINLEDAIEKKSRNLSDIGYPKNFRTFKHFTKSIDIPVAIKS